ncbi:MAG: DUF975 family protein [Oscillospiraceae bacterium]|nr:DUF975 family protein [Oscillospiraceae bacterium]MBQ4239594.1 DUF975 family protein [Oscillospiraceae bacterium]MBQ5412148.1 DUF975 family protein [Oscillospiraceae bacterium]
MVYWDSKTLKKRAKDVLTGHYWGYFLVVIVCGIIGGTITRFNIRIDFNSMRFRSIEELIRYTLNWLYTHYPSFLTSIAVSGVGKTLWKIFVGNPFEVGHSRYRTLASYKRYDFQNIFFPFAEGKYLKSVVTLLLRDLYVFLWGLLFVIPGIVKSYSYFMVPYILAENPNISRQRAFEISKRATRGEKWRMFVFDLSFLGWFFLGTLCLGVGVLFVMPYYEAGQAELYGALRFKAVRESICGPNEIGSELFRA